MVFTDCEYSTDSLEVNKTKEGVLLTSRDSLDNEVVDIALDKESALALAEYIFSVCGKDE